MANFLIHKALVRLAVILNIHMPHLFVVLKRNSRTMMKWAYSKFTHVDNNFGHSMPACRITVCRRVFT